MMRMGVSSDFRCSPSARALAEWEVYVCAARTVNAMGSSQDRDAAPNSTSPRVRGEVGIQAQAREFRVRGRFRIPEHIES
ncbi:MAG: hypothetical protein WA418_35345, partial [Bradyrhizobium sp.]